jgi:asparagine synthase (glutamine-hydrolysing)
MCGIAGYVGDFDEGLLSRMSDFLKDRGPDGMNFYSDPFSQVHLCHARLIIIDPEGGIQPMWNEDNSVCVIFNGEIYNHRELRSELEGLGHKFKSDHSDTEVLVHGYEAWGRGLLEKLNGMFAFCIYDINRKILFIARDRFGKKPLYYAIYNKGIAFSSNLNSLRLHPKVNTEISPLGVQKYFAYGFIPAPNTIYKDVFKLPGGHGLIFNLQNCAFEIFQYWQYEIIPSEHYENCTEEEVCEELKFKLIEATKLRMDADVPVGIFLSGGVDSSAILACASIAGTKSLSTFSIGFKEKQFDESFYAELVAKRFNTNHFSKIFSFKDARLVSEYVLSNLDEPMADSSILPTFLLAQFAREHVKVALSGEGGDELFAGYAPFKALRAATIFKEYTTEGLRKFIAAAVKTMPVSEKYMSIDFKLKRALAGVEGHQSTWNPAWIGPLGVGDLNELCAEKYSSEEIYSEAISAWNDSKAVDLVGKTSEFYAKLYMQDGILTKVDRASMMVGLEVRSPFLDNNVVEMARQLPSRLKLKNNTSKYILKKTVAQDIGIDIAYRVKKGFSVPLTAWLKDWTQFGNGFYGLKNSFFLKKLNDHRSGKADNRLFLWAWIVINKFSDKLI